MRKAKSLKILPLFIPHSGCPFTCVYCNQHLITHRSSYSIADFAELIEGFCKHNKEHLKEIAFYGGSFTILPQDTQKQLFLIASKYLDENTHIRISTRPDAIDDDILTFCRSNGVRTIELGIQSFDDNVLHASKRGYTSRKAKEAAELIRESSLTLGIQLMPGLPGFNECSLQKTIDDTIQSKPAFVRIYPTVVLKNTILANWYKNGKYEPLTIEKAIKHCAKMAVEFEENDIEVAKIGLHSGINDIIAGPYHPGFAELVWAEVLMNNILSKYEKNKTLIISERDVSLFKGNCAKMLKKMKAKLGTQKLPVSIDSELKTRNFRLTDTTPQYYW